MPPMPRPATCCITAIRPSSPSASIPANSNSGENPLPILTDIQYQARVGRVGFAASDSGLLVAQNSGAVSFSQFIWFDRKGNQIGVVGKARFVRQRVLGTRREIGGGRQDGHSEPEHRCVDLRTCNAMAPNG